MTEPPEPGRDAPGRRTGPEDQGQRDACSGTAGDSGGPARAVPAAHNCSRCTRTFLFLGFFLKLFKLLPLPPTPPAAKGKKKEEGKRLERKHRFATPKKNRGGKEKRKVQRLGFARRQPERGPSDVGLRAQAAASCDWSHDARPGAVRSRTAPPLRRSPGAGRAVPRRRRPPGRPPAEVTGLGRWGARALTWLRLRGVVPLRSRWTRELFKRGET